VLEIRVWRIRNRIAGTIARGDLRDCIAPGAICGIAKTGVVWIEVHKPDLDVVL
jgi:hypothetical protein